ncbi:unnamed protein product [Aspergillus oryzae RIB40]|uniref:DNA, SC138 n=1 Tax=Aspergillus oryzae (strain ATCC 42149 / RIB 40) TaxID=510516 RepID=Q2U1P1_ASPOR|nr:unnamed protein product [Aspergillus oryzae RIB40]BAE64524.1 unnamed protein product [Aspergillus oryzae RIB40]
MIFDKGWETASAVKVMNANHLFFASSLIWGRQEDQDCPQVCILVRNYDDAKGTFLHHLKACTFANIVNQITDLKRFTIEDPHVSRLAFGTGSAAIPRESRYHIIEIASFDNPYLWASYTIDSLGSPPLAII